jgi:hypothetical protein
MIVLSVSLHTEADDTDIFFNPTPNEVSNKPMIMLYLDYRPNLSAPTCSATDPECATLIEEKFLSADPIKYGDSYSGLEIYRAVLKKVMNHEIGEDDSIPPQPILVKDVALFGLMMSHHNINGCDDGPTETDCSNGGFILSKFRDLSIPAQFDIFFDKLESIPIPQSKWNDYTEMIDLVCSTCTSLL